MGKSLKGKELGTGVSQRKDGLYTGRVTDRTGKRIQKYFKKLAECKKWVADMQYEIDHGNALYSENPLVDVWFNFWLESVKGHTVKETTKNRYEQYYQRYIKEHIGNLKIQDVKPAHCSAFLNEMGEKYSYSTVSNVRNLMYSFFDSAQENSIIKTNPITKNVKPSGEKQENIRYLTINEQIEFLSRTQKSKNYYFFAFALQTGLRVGELQALTWEDVNFDKKVLYVNKSIYETSTGELKVGSPKSKSGYRIVPLTKEAIYLLQMQKKLNASRKIIQIEYKNYIFINMYGKISYASNYDMLLLKYCKKYNVKNFSMHSLRHTFATRCIEFGMRPKTLQKILGHSKLSMTMDLYVHVTEEAKLEEVFAIEDYLKIG